MCQAFQASGNNLTLIIPEIKETFDILDYYSVQKKFKINKIPVKSPRGKTTIFLLKAIKKIKKQKPDFVFTRSLSGAFFCTLFGVPTILELHGPVGKKNFYFRQILKKKSIIKIIVLSKKLQDFLIKEFKIPRKKIQVEYNGADLPISGEKVPKIEFPNEDLSLNVGYIGQLYPGKGMEIVEYLAKNCPWAFFHIVGGIEKDILYWKERLIGRKNLKFYGFLPYEEAEKIRLSMDVLLAPCKKDVSVYSGVTFQQEFSPPIKIFEYMATGKAIIASNFLDEVLTNKENSFLCDPFDFQSWENALIKLKDEKLREKFGREAKEEFLKKFTWEKRAERILKNLDRG